MLAGRDLNVGGLVLLLRGKTVGRRRVRRGVRALGGWVLGRMLMLGLLRRIGMMLLVLVLLEHTRSRMRLRRWQALLSGVGMMLEGARALARGARRESRCGWSKDGRRPTPAARRRWENRE